LNSRSVVTAAVVIIKSTRNRAEVAEGKAARMERREARRRHSGISSSTEGNPEGLDIRDMAFVTQQKDLEKPKSIESGMSLATGLSVSTTASSGTFSKEEFNKVKQERDMFKQERDIFKQEKDKLKQENDLFFRERAPSELSEDEYVQLKALFAKVQRIK